MPSQRKNKNPAFSIQDDIPIEKLPQAILDHCVLKALIEDKSALEKRLRQINKAIPCLYRSWDMEWPTVEECEQKIQELKQRCEKEYGVKVEPTKEEIKKSLKRAIELPSRLKCRPGRPASDFNDAVWGLKKKNPDWTQKQIADELAGRPEFANSYERRAEGQEEINKYDISRQMQSRVAKIWDDPRQYHLPLPDDPQ